MPLYEVEHCIPLSREERDAIAEAITHVHTLKFTVPSLFVNIRFTDVKDHCIYVAGKQRSVNRIIGTVRGGGTRTAESFDELALELEAVWNRVINDGKKGHGDREMKVVSVQGAIVAGVENGFLTPRAGTDVAWLKSNRTKFEQLAAEGDADFSELVHEMQHREDLVRSLNK